MPSLNDTKGRDVEGLKKLGTILGYTAPSYDDLIQAQKVELSENSRFDNLLKMVIYHRIDGVYVTINPTLYQLREVLKQADALVFDSDLPYDYADHLLSTITHPEVINALNVFLSEEKDLLEQLKKKYKITESRQD